MNWSEKRPVLHRSVYSPAFPTGDGVRSIFPRDFYFYMLGTGDVKCAVGYGVYPCVAFYVQHLGSAEQAGRFTADGNAVACAVSACFKDGTGKDWQLFGSVCAKSAYLVRGAEVCGGEISFGYEANAVFRCGQYLEDRIGCVGSDLFGNYQGC